MRSNIFSLLSSYEVKEILVKMHTTMHSPKMTRSLQQISDKFGGSLGSLPSVNKLQLGDRLHTVQVKVCVVILSERGRKLFGVV